MTTVPATRPPRAPAPLPMTPGRWLALIIGVPIAVALICWSGFSIVSAIGRASFPVAATIPLENGRLVASTGGADITLHQDQARGSAARLAEGWLRPVSDDPQDRRDGFGLAAWGTW
jgi:hypothetical protein